MENHIHIFSVISSQEYLKNNPRIFGESKSERGILRVCHGCKGVLLVVR